MKNPKLSLYLPVLILLPFSLLLILPGYGCSGQPKQMKLEYQLGEGNTYRQRTVTEQTVRQVFNGEEQTVVNTIESVMSYKVISVSGDTTALEVSYDTLDILISLPGQEMHFSSKGNFWRQEDLFSQVLNTMAGKTFRMELNNKTGKVISISGLEKLFETVLNQFMTGREDQITSVMEMLNKSYGEGAFKDGFETANAYFKSGEIREGDSWETTSHLANINGVLNIKWKLEKLNKKEAVLKGEGQLHTEDADKEVYVEGVSTRINLSGTQSATLNVDPQTGWTQSGKVEQHFEGTIKLHETASGEEAELPLQMINIITYSTIE